MTREKKLSFIETYKRNTRDKKMKITYYLMMLEQSNDKMEVSQLKKLSIQKLSVNHQRKTIMLSIFEIKD